MQMPFFTLLSVLKIMWNKNSMNTEFSKCTEGGSATKEIVWFKTNDAELFLVCLSDESAQFIRLSFF